MLSVLHHCPLIIYRYVEAILDIMKQDKYHFCKVSEKAVSKNLSILRLSMVFRVGIYLGKLVYLYKREKCKNSNFES